MLLLAYCSRRKALLSQFGLLGIGRKALWDGDVIAVSKLSQHPMVLRRAEDARPDYYTMLGAAFVKDIHSGKEIFTAAAEGERIGIICLV